MERKQKEGPGRKHNQPEVHRRSISFLHLCVCVCNPALSSVDFLSDIKRSSTSHLSTRASITKFEVGIPMRYSDKKKVLLSAKTQPHVL